MTLGFNTKAIHGKTGKKDIHQAIKYPIYAGVAYDFETAEDLEKAFKGQKLAHTYSRITNPTVEAFENKITALENALGSIAVSSGMAAIADVFLNLLRSDDHLICASSLFGGTYSLLEKTLKPFAINTTYTDIDSLAAIKKAIKPKTKIIFFETIANPKMNVPDIKAITDLAHRHDIVVVVDSTMTTPYLFAAKNYGVDIVIHSSTKLISGGATSVGGVIVDLGNYDWTKAVALEKYHHLKQWAFIARLRKEVYRDLGTCLSPHNAYLQSLGLETLSIRVDKCCANTIQIAEFLSTHKKVKKINYPGLKSSPYHKLAKKQFNEQFGAVLSFELADKKTCFEFLNKLKLIKRATNLGDNTTLVIHPGSTIFVEYAELLRQSMGVTDGLIRLSAGLEDAHDLINDLKQALI